MHHLNSGHNSKYLNMPRKILMSRSQARKAFNQLAKQTIRSRYAHSPVCSPNLVDILVVPILQTTKIVNMINNSSNIKKK